MILAGWLVFALLASSCSAPHPSAAANSPIAFVQDNDKIYVRYGDGLIRYVARGQEVAWTPDRKMLLVKRVRYTDPPSAEIWLMGLNGAAIRQETDVYPDQVRFFSAGILDHHQVLLYDTNKPGIRIANIDGPHGRSLPVNAVIDDVVASRDGSKIALITDSAQTPDIPSALYIVNSDGSGRRRLVIADNQYRHVSCPTFSPDGQWLAVTLSVNQGSPGGVDLSVNRGSPGGAVTRIWLIRPNGTGLHVLTGGDEPIWSPDGSWIAYSGEVNGQFGIYKIHPDGTGRSRVMSYPLSSCVLAGFSW